MAKLSIDKLAPSKSLIDLTGFAANSLDSTLIGYDLENVLDDIVLTELIDVGQTGNEIIRNGLVIPVNAEAKAWRIGKVVLCGKGCTLVEKGDLICFPNNMGINISKIGVVGYGTIEYGQFLNEHRIFGVVKPKTEKNVNNTSKPSSRSKK
jgi:hypothetical protein